MTGLTIAPLLNTLNNIVAIVLGLFTAFKIGILSGLALYGLYVLALIFLHFGASMLNKFYGYEAVEMMQRLPGTVFGVFSVMLLTTANILLYRHFLAA